ncbi:quinolinate synthase NadA [Dyella jiangningensis]|uniref:quinolinate synthase NadA n=1 Tax=Dyella jiangningensis TaxID=1379159 RepID=UPI0024103E8A|nr:quinolinate synthase NadA [Dyella jiangningensis]MDG2539206.1 quinolinate synthase NadA [Dyella jiangningensis]
MANSTDATVPNLTEELLDEYADLGESLKARIPCTEWNFHVPWIHAIRELKRKRNAVIMAHNYQAPEIFHTVADFTGDSLALAQEAANVDADIVVLAGVHFMAESAKILAPDRMILIPDVEAGCSLASSITAAEVRELRRRHPGVPVVTYVNTSAEVKAESDACCTSANALQVVEAMGTDRVIFIPDRYLGANVAKQTSVELILWEGACEVHERFTANQVNNVRIQFQAKVVAHPECPPDVTSAADFVGSTSAMSAWLKREQPSRVALITECSMADNLRVEFPEIDFVKPCNLCPHMQRITLPGIHRSLRDLTSEVHVPADVARRARYALERMLAIGRGEKV